MRLLRTLLYVLAVALAGCASVQLGVVPKPGEQLGVKRVELTLPLGSVWVAYAQGSACVVEREGWNVEPGSWLACRWQRAR